MSESVVIGYKSKFAAEEVRLQLLKIQREYLIDLGDAVVAIKSGAGTRGKELPSPREV